MSPSRPPSISAAFLETFPGCSGRRGGFETLPPRPLNEPRRKGLTRVSFRLQVRFTPVGVGVTDGSGDSERSWGEGGEGEEKGGRGVERGRGRTTCDGHFPTGGPPHCRWFAFGARKAIRWRVISDNKCERNSLLYF